jgi:hypothetical protein
VQRIERENKPVQLTRPTIGATRGTVTAYTPSETGKLLAMKEMSELYDIDSFDLYTTAQDLARNYRLEAFDILSELRRMYPEGYIPVSQ